MMLNTSFSCSGLSAVNVMTGHAPSEPPFAIRTLVIEGDSITLGMPSTYSGGFYSYRYQPAVWGQWADYYLPLGEHPDWIADPPLSPSLWGDGVHPTGFDAVNGTGGQNRLYDQFKAAVDTLADNARANATAPYESVWPVDENSLATGAAIVRRFVVSGIAHTGLASGIAVSGGDARVRLNGAAWDTGIGRIYNGDVIDLKLTTSASYETTVTVDLTIGSETRAIGYTTTADVAPVVYTHGGIATDMGNWPSMTFPALTFGNGLAVLAIKSKSNGGAPLSTAPTLGGTPLTFAGRAVLAGWSVIELWTGPVTAGDHDVVVTYPTTDTHHVVSYGTLTGADAAAIDVQGNAPGSESDPHLTAAVTVPENGLALAWFYEDAGDPMTPVSCNAPTVQIDEGHVVYEGGTEGFVVGSLAASGQASFNAGAGNFVRIIAVWQAEGN